MTQNLNRIFYYKTRLFPLHYPASHSARNNLCLSHIEQTKVYMINWDYLVEQRLDSSEWFQRSQKKWKEGTGNYIYVEKEQGLFSSPSCRIVVSASTHGGESAVPGLFMQRLGRRPSEFLAVERKFSDFQGRFQFCGSSSNFTWIRGRFIFSDNFLFRRITILVMET